MLRFIFSKLAEKKNEASFWDHVDVLRIFIIRSFLFIIVFSIVAFFLKDFIFNKIILAPKNSDFITYQFLCKLGKVFNTETLCINTVDFSLININLGGQFRWHILISVISGIMLAFPLIIWQLWIFIKPALHKNEHKQGQKMILYCLILFLIGNLFGYYLILPLSVQFLGSYTLSEIISNQININSYISTVAVIPFSLGITFELPVMVYFLTSIGILKDSFLKKNRKYSIVVVLILAAIITPTTDAFTMMVVAMPLYLLYEISIIISAKIEKRFAKII